MDINNTILSVQELGMEKGDVIYVEKAESYYASPTEITDITKNSIEFYAPTYQTGGTINFKPGESIKMYYWTRSGQKYCFSSIIQGSKSLSGTFTVSMPTKIQLDGGRRWKRYKPVNMLVSFLQKTSNNSLQDTVHIARVVNISAGGMLITTPKRFNIEDSIGVGFYVGDTFFTALCLIKSANASKLNLGENDIALQFTNYTEQDKEFLESKLYLLHR